MPAPRKRQQSQNIPSAVPQYEDCWAKTTKDNRPGISVRDHCLNVGCVAEALLDRLPDWLKAALELNNAPILAALHDIGKISPGFQSKCEKWLLKQGIPSQVLQEGWSASEQDHAKVSQFAIQQILNRSALWNWSAIIGAHHGKFKQLRIISISEPNHESWQAERQRLVKELIEVFGSLPEQSSNEATLFFYAGLITVADWLGSNEDYFPLQISRDLQEMRNLSQQALDSLVWKNPQFQRGLSFERLFNNYSPNSLQLASIENIRERGLYIIEAPMGMGKTEAALAASYNLIEKGKANGIYFALPTQVTSNRIHLRIRQFLENSLDFPAHLRLAHSSSWLQEENAIIHLNSAGHDSESYENARTGSFWFASSKRALLAPFGVGTVDQALLGIVAANHFFVRQFGLAGKVVILDEVHSYDLYTGTLIKVLVDKLLKLQSTVIILSATLTKARRRQFLPLEDQQPLSDEYPLLSGICEEQIEISCEPPSPKTFLIRFLDGERIIEECIDRAEQGQCVLWIRNTVEDAQISYRLLKSANRQGGPEIALMHARFPFFRREQLEEEWMERLGKSSDKRPNGCILVSTQVAEQSVDIDADLLISDLAPTDMLLQRMGRLWRHNRNRPSAWRPEIWIQSLSLDGDQLLRATEKEICTALGKSARVYAPYVLLRSLQQWLNRENIILPGDIRAILEATYSEPADEEPEAWKKLHDDIERKKHELTARAISAANVWAQPALPDEEGIQTRYSKYPTAYLLLVKSFEWINSHNVRLHFLEGSPEEVGDINWNFNAARSICRNLVRVPRWVLSTALLKPPSWLTNHVSQQTAVGLLQLDGAIYWPGSDVKTGLFYYEDLGIVINRKLMPHKASEEFDESYD